jgi:hypothetical protein
LASQILKINILSTVNPWKADVFASVEKKLLALLAVMAGYVKTALIKR